MLTTSIYSRSTDEMSKAADRLMLIHQPVAALRVIFIALSALSGLTAAATLVSAFALGALGIPGMFDALLILTAISVGSFAVGEGFRILRNRIDARIHGLLNCVTRKHLAGHSDVIEQIIANSRVSI